MNTTKLLAIMAMTWLSFSALAVCPVQETTVFYVNGIDTEIKEADGSKDRLSKELAKDARFRPDCVFFDTAYNTNEVFVLNLVEGLIQKTAENTGVDNFPWGQWLRAESPAEWFESFVADSIFLPVKGLIETGRFFLGDQRQAHADKYKEQLQLGRQVILVGHSQGNAYANESRGLLSLTQQESTRAVAASALVFPEPDNTRYTSLDQDTLVQGIFALLGAPPFNVVLVEPGPGSCRFIASSSPIYCHAFVETYMTYQKTRDKIVDDIVALLPQAPMGNAGALCTPNDTGGSGFGFNVDGVILRAGFKYTPLSTFSITSLQIRLATTAGGAPDTRYRMKVYDGGSDSNPESGTLLSTSPWYESSNLSTSFATTIVEVAWSVERGHTYYGIMEDETGWTLDHTIFMETCSGTPGPQRIS